MCGAIGHLRPGTRISRVTKKGGRGEESGGEKRGGEEKWSREGRLSTWRKNLVKGGPLTFAGCKSEVRKGGSLTVQAEGDTEAELKDK